jgi:hypothetical protein
VKCELCGESLPIYDVIHHVRVMHPDVYEPDLMDGPVVTVNVRGSLSDEQFNARLLAAVRNGLQRGRGLA